MEKLEKRRILLIGDLRPAFNYGAVATCDVLIARIRERLSPDDELRIIDYRSFFTQTPLAGFQTWSYPVYPKDPLKLRRLLMREKLRATLRDFKRKARGKSSAAIDPLPARWKDYPAFSQSVMNGVLFPYEKHLFEWADEVIINSEGNIVNGIEPTGKYRRGARYVLAMAYLAQFVFKKPTSIINFTVDPKNPDAEEIIREIFPHLERVIPREPLSIPELHRIGVTREVNWAPDILFSYKPNSKAQEQASMLMGHLNLPSSNYVCLGDSSGLRSLASVVKWDVEGVFATLIGRIRSELGKEVVLIDGFNEIHPALNRIASRMNVPKVSLLNCSYESLIEVLSKADLFISGRWHASIMASLNGTPFLLWGSDSHKTRALHVIFESPYRFFHVDSLPIHLDDLIDDARAILAAGPTLRESIKDRARSLGVESLRMLDFISAKP
jgi:hypothetical protein